MRSWWSLLFVMGAVVGFVGLPALLGYLAGSRVDANATIAHPIPFRLLFVAIGVGAGGLVAWRVLSGPRRQAD